MNEQLLPCPVCDSEPKMDASGHDAWSYPYCPTCAHVHGLVLDTTEEEIAAWNKAATATEDKRKRIKRLEVENHAMEAMLENIAPCCTCSQNVPFVLCPGCLAKCVLQSVRETRGMKNE